MRFLRRDVFSYRRSPASLAKRLVMSHRSDRQAVSVVEKTIGEDKTMEKMLQIAALALVAGALVCLSGCNQAAGKDPATKALKPAGAEGDWQGALSVPGGQLHMVFHVKRGADGMLTATLDSPDQGAYGIACSHAMYVDGSLTIESSVIGGTFAGKMDPGGGKVAGTWSQGTSTFPLTILRSDKPIAGLNRPQEPKPPFPYEGREVTYENTRDKVKLAGALTLPKGGGPFPAALLITGSGPQNRDEELFGHKPFHVIADYLTRRGIAVLRVDDRGVGSSTGSMANASSQDFAEDVKSGVAYLKTVKEIDPKRIGLIGHSEGGLIAPMVAAQDPSIAFIVLMAGTGVTGEQVMYKQAELIDRAMGMGDDAMSRNHLFQSIAFSAVREEKDDAAAAKRIRREIDQKIVAKLPEAARKSPQVSPAAIEAQVQTVLSPWFRFFLTHDPAETLHKVRCPVLALNGEKDLQVSPAQNLPAIKAALAAGGNKDFQTLLLPGLNHLFQTCTSGAPAEYGQIEETISPAALKAMGDWIEAHAGPAHR
jgi:pimeloyl-ACP methyl ester carboxylesterase